MKITVSSDSDNGTSDVRSWLDFNCLNYGVSQFWNTEDKVYNLPSEITDNVVVCDHVVLQNFMQEKSWQARQIDSLKEFCRRGNQLWIIGTDTGVILMQNAMKHFVQALDADIVPAGIVLFVDAAPSDRCYLNNLKHIQIRVLTTNLFNRGLPRCQSPTLAKKSCPHDFLLTMRKKRDRPHRDVLWQEMNRRPGLIDRGLAVVHPDTHDSWQGTVSHQHAWHCGHASMDLYLKCWLEIVPETCYQDLYFFTEKTQKPIMTCTPFLVISTAGYLDWLQQQGFCTFHSLIDEGYDRHHRVEDRVRHMVDVLEDITRNGAESFYQASRDILDHNLHRLCEISGGWWFGFDQVMWRALEDFDIFGNNPVPQ